MYDYCPLALYSGERSKMEYALASLIYDPHRNLRIFVDGNSVHDDSDSPKNFDEKILTDLIFPGTPNANIQIFIKIVSFSFTSFFPSFFLLNLFILSIWI